MITDELREYANKAIHREDYMAGMTFDLNRIADRIDEEHERQQEDLIDETLGGLIKMTDENMAKNGWIRLPKDADGVPIHIGDVMKSIDSFFFEVQTLRCDDNGWDVIGPLGERYHPHGLRHRHEPTVEDVLREMMREASCNIYADGTCEMGLTDEQLAKYAQRLQLRDE